MTTEKSETRMPSRYGVWLAGVGLGGAIVIGGLLGLCAGMAWMRLVR